MSSLGEDRAKSHVVAGNLYDMTFRYPACEACRLIVIEQSNAFLEVAKPGEQHVVLVDACVEVYCKNNQQMVHQ